MKLKGLLVDSVYWLTLCYIKRTRNTERESSTQANTLQGVGMGGGGGGEHRVLTSTKTKWLVNSLSLRWRVHPRNEHPARSAPHRGCTAPSAVHPVTCTSYYKCAHANTCPPRYIYTYTSGLVHVLEVFTPVWVHPAACTTCSPSGAAQT